MDQDQSSALVTERRRQARSALNLHVRFLLQDGTEHGGVVSDVSVGGMNIVSDATPAEGSIIIAYVEDLGRLEGIVARVDDHGIAIRLTLSALRRDKLEERLGSGRKTHEGRRYQRDAADGITRILRADGRELSGRVIDLSLGGVSVETAEWPPLGEQVIVGKMRGRVVRHHETGFAIEFSEIPPSRGSLAEQLTTGSERAA